MSRLVLTRNLPLKSGAIKLYAFIGPNPLYCPVINSAKNIGKPMNIAERKYGNKNAPPPFL